jgi:hypothetical protein
MAKPVNLSNGRRWETKKEAINHYKQMLSRYRDGDKIGDASDHQDLVALLECYDGVVAAGGQTKGGAGILYFSRQRNEGDKWSTSGFHVHRKDGTSIDFSFYSAVDAAATKLTK